MIEHPYLIVFVMTIIIIFVLYMVKYFFPVLPDHVCFICGSKECVAHVIDMDEDVCRECLNDLESGER